jgi:RNA polymerase sigma-70 factor (ECF subfamily)
MMPPAEGESDADIMVQVQEGERERFALLIKRYQPALLRVARSRLGDASLADDVVQETFLSVYKARHTYDPGRSFRTWLWTILINQCRAHGQRQSRWLRLFSWHLQRSPEDCTRLEQCVDEPAVEPLTRLLANERAEVLEKLLARLPTPQADALRLRFFGGLKFHEIADALGCSLLTAKNRVRVGLLRLSQMISSGEAPPRSNGQSAQPFGR